MKKILLICLSFLAVNTMFSQKKNITLEFYSSHSNSNLLQIFDLQGQLLWQTELQVLNGKNQVEVPLSQFSTGTYSLFLVDNEANKKRIHHLVIID